MKDNQPPLPPGAMYTAFLTQEMLDEASVALGRPLFGHEVKLLDNILTGEAKRRMKRSKDEIMNELVRIADRPT